MENTEKQISLNSEKKISLFSCTAPCKNCPYRKDAPKRLWHREEFKRLLENENDFFGKVYMCHKKNGSVCIGWLIDQDNRNHPSIALRMAFIKNNITRTYLDKLKSPVPLFFSVKAMVRANFPSLLNKKR